jgi:L-fuconolactonase
LLALAAHDNIAVKISGAGTMSHRPFPYDDLWDPLCRIFDAFGLERCLWGTDWTRAVEFLSYRQAVDAFLMSDRLSGDDRAMLMGGALQRIYGWTPRPAG